MGCTATREPLEQKLCKSLYTFFMEGKPDEIIKLGAEDCTMDFTECKVAPYKGMFKGEECMDFFKKINEAWGPQVCNFQQSDWKTLMDGKLECKCHIAVCKAGGGMILGVEKHTWEVDSKTMKWKSFTCTETGFLDVAFTEKTMDEKCIEVAKYCVQLFNTGQTALMTEKVWSKDGVMKVGTGADEKEKSIPYAGEWKETNGLNEGFAALAKAWKPETGSVKSFTPIEDSWECKDGNLTVLFNVLVELPNGKKIENKSEKHTGIFKTVDVEIAEGKTVKITKCFNWTVEDVSAHIVGFEA